MNDNLLNRKPRHYVEAEPNRALPGYYHVSVSPDGLYRSTLKIIGQARRDHLSARQRRKRDKLTRRLIKEDRETAN